MKHLTVIMLAWFLVYQPYNQRAIQLGPFVSQAECSRIATSIRESRTASFVSSCWQG